jgi:hypothetical protein
MGGFKRSGSSSCLLVIHEARDPASFLVPVTNSIVGLAGFCGSGEAVDFDDGGSPLPSTTKPERASASQSLAPR